MKERVKVTCSQSAAVNAPGSTSVTYVTPTINKKTQKKEEI